MDFDEERLSDPQTFCWRFSRQLRSWLDDPYRSLPTRYILWQFLFQWADMAASGLALSCPRTFWKVHQPDHIFLSLFFIFFSFITCCKLNQSPKRQNNLSRQSTGNAALVAMSTLATLSVHPLFSFSQAVKPCGRSQAVSVPFTNSEWPWFMWFM